MTNDLANSAAIRGNNRDAGSHRLAVHKRDSFAILGRTYEDIAQADTSDERAGEQCTRSYAAERPASLPKTPPVSYRAWRFDCPAMKRRPQRPNVGNGPLYDRSCTNQGMQSFLRYHPADKQQVVAFIHLPSSPQLVFVGCERRAKSARFNTRGNRLEQMRIRWICAFHRCRQKRNDRHNAVYSSEHAFRFLSGQLRHEGQRVQRQYKRCLREHLPDGGHESRPIFQLNDIISAAPHLPQSMFQICSALAGPFHSNMLDAAGPSLRIDGNPAYRLDTTVTRSFRAIRRNVSIIQVSTEPPSKGGTGELSREQ